MALVINKHSGFSGLFPALPNLKYQAVNRLNEKTERKASIILPVEKSQLVAFESMRLTKAFRFISFIKIAKRRANISIMIIP